MLRVGIVANEPSGDLLGSRLIRAIQQQVSDVQFEGVGGPLMQEAGCKSLFPMDKLSVMGLVEVLKHLPELLSIRKQLVHHFTNNKPDIFIGIDAPDFNLGLEKALKAQGIPTVHYVSPTVWAWRPKRIKKIRQAVDLMLSIFPFEQAYLRDQGMTAAYVGHPLAEEIPLDDDRSAARTRLGLPANGTIIAVLPGSRASEIESLSEVFLQTAQLLHQRDPKLRFVVPLINARTAEGFTSIQQRVAPDLPLVKLQGQARDAMEAANLVLTASGTATLEAMLVKRPMVVAYRLNPLTYWLVTRFNLVKIPYVAMANLLAGEMLAPEFIQHEATPEGLAEALNGFLQQPLRVTEVEKKYRELHRTLKQDSGRLAASAVLNLLEQGK